MNKTNKIEKRIITKEEAKKVSGGRKNWSRPVICEICLTEYYGKECPNCGHHNVI